MNSIDGGIGGSFITSSSTKNIDACLQRDWQNVQDAVKGSFFFIAAVLQEQHREIHQLKQQLAEQQYKYETKESIAKALATKADIADFIKLQQQQSHARNSLYPSSPPSLSPSHHHHSRRRSLDEEVHDQEELLEHQRRIASLQTAVHELQRQGREVVVGLEQVKRKTSTTTTVEELLQESSEMLHTLEMEVKEVRKDLSQKADHDVMETQLKRRPAWNELEAILREKADVAMVERLSLHKASLSDLDRLEDRMLEKVGREDIQRLVLAELAQHPPRKQIEALVGGAANANASSSSFEGAGRQREEEEGEREVEKEATMKALQSVQREVRAEVINLQGEVSESMRVMNDRIEYMREAYQEGQVQLVQVLNRKAYKSEVGRWLEEKAEKKELDDKIDRDEVMKLLEDKADVQEVKETFERLSKHVTKLTNQVSATRGEVRKEVLEICESMMLSSSHRLTTEDDLQKLRLSTLTSNNWQLALGELSLSLRRELEEKPSREEVQQRLHHLEEEVTSLKGGQQQEVIAALEKHVTKLSRRVASELTGGRWLWRSGQIGQGGWIPWEIQIANAAPDSLIWKKGTTGILTKLPGLYRLVVGVFTREVGILQVCIDGETTLTLESENTPDAERPHEEGETRLGTSQMSTGTTNSRRRRRRPTSHVLHRSSHSAGEVASLSIQEYLSLPPRATVSVRIEIPTRAQGFLQLIKL